MSGGNPKQFRCLTVGIILRGGYQAIEIPPAVIMQRLTLRAHAGFGFAEIDQLTLEGLASTRIAPSRNQLGADLLGS